MTDDKALEILDKVITNLPKSWGCYEQARQALLHLERNRTSSRVSMGPLDALDAIGVEPYYVENLLHTTEEDVREYMETDMKRRLGAGAAQESIPNPKWIPVGHGVAKASLSGVFLTEEQLKQYWSVLAYGE